MLESRPKEYATPSPTCRMGEGHSPLRPPGRRKNVSGRPNNASSPNELADTASRNRARRAMRNDRDPRAMVILERTVSIQEPSIELDSRLGNAAGTRPPYPIDDSIHKS